MVWESIQSQNMRVTLPELQRKPQWETFHQKSVFCLELRCVKSDLSRCPAVPRLSFVVLELSALSVSSCLERPFQVSRLGMNLLFFCLCAIMVLKWGCDPAPAVTPAPLMRNMSYPGNYTMEQGGSVLGYLGFFQMILLEVHRQVSLKSSP